MARPTNSSLPIVAALFLAAAWGCTTNKQEAPPLTGPSEMGTSIAITVSPDVLRQDGASQSLVTVTARDSQGQPLRNLSLRAEITVDGAITDFGSLSAKNVVTDTSGRATLTYTAPGAAPILFDNGTIVGITVSPMGTDFGNATAKTVDIRLVPPGVIGAPPSPFRPEFTAPSATAGDPALFSAVVTDASGADVTNQVASFRWTFGDGQTGSTRNISHTYREGGSYPVSLTITDPLGRVAQVVHSVVVAAGANPTASITTSPSSPGIGQVVTFRAVSPVVAPGHTITDYSWDFGDGHSGSGATTTHAYSQAGSYTVVLSLSDDAGRDGTVSTGVSVGQAVPTATFTTSPQSPIVNQSINFNASQSQASPGTGRTIVSYAWDFGDSTPSGSGVQTTHAFAVQGTYIVTLTVTDSAGQTAFASQTITVGNGNPTADFSFNPSAPRGGQQVTFDGSASQAQGGRTIVSYSWSFGDGGSGVGQTVTHAFGPVAVATTYNVLLTVTDSAGKTSSVTKPITINP